MPTDLVAPAYQLEPMSGPPPTDRPRPSDTEATQRRRTHVAELNGCAADAELRFWRRYGAIAVSIADLDDPILQGCFASIKAIRDQARADPGRAQAMLQSSEQGGGGAADFCATPLFLPDVGVVAESCSEQDSLFESMGLGGFYDQA